MKGHQRFAFLAIVLIALTSFGLYLNSINNSFHFDDLPNIVENPSIRDLRDIQSIYKGIVTQTGRFRALTTLSFAVNYHFHRLDVRGYHLFNILLHLFSGILVFFISRHLFHLNRPGRASYGSQTFDPEDRRTNVLSLLVALIFVSHPIQVNTVTYVVQRNEGLSSFFYLLCFFLFVKGSLSDGIRKAFYWIGTVLTFFCSALSKEIGLTLPILLILFDLIFICRDKNALLKRLRVYVPFFLLLALFILFFLRGGMLRQFLDGAPEWFWTPWENLLTQSNVIVQYVKLLLLPLPGWLNVDHDFRVYKSLFEYPTFLSFAAIAFLLLFAILRARKNKLTAFSIFWFLIVLAPTSSLLPLWDIMVEYRLYLPLFAYALLLSSAVDHLYRYLALTFSRKSGLTVVTALSLLVLCFYSVVTLERNRVFKNDVTLWADALKKSPRKMRVHHNLGRAYYEMGRVDEAIREGKIALTLMANTERKEIVKYVFNLLGGAYLEKGNLDQALTFFRQATEVDANFATSYYNMACVYAIQKEKEKALQHLKKAVSLDPKYKDKARNDSDLQSLHGDKEFEELIR